MLLMENVAASSPFWPISTGLSLLHITVIDCHSIFSMGIGYTDVHLLASALLDKRAALWARDKRLQAAAEKAGARMHIATSLSN